MPRGRTKDPAKKQAILDAARDLCMRGEPNDVTVEQIIKAAGVSKTAFYSNFPDIDGALEAVIRRESERIASESLLTESAEDDLGATLTSIGDRMLDLLTGPAMGGFDRFVAHVARTRPELAKRFYDAGPGRSHAILTEFLRRCGEHGRLRFDDPAEAASDLFGLWQGSLPVRASFGQRLPTDLAEGRKRVARGVRLFLTLYAAQVA